MFKINNVYIKNLVVNDKFKILKVIRKVLADTI